MPAGRTGDQESLFLLEAYYDKVSIINEIEEGDPVFIRAHIASMEKICHEH